MLILTRHAGQIILVGDVAISIVEVLAKKKTRMGIKKPGCDLTIATLNVGQRMVIDNFSIVIVEVRGRNWVRVGIDAPRSVPILRAELTPHVAATNERAGNVIRND